MSSNQFEFAFDELVRTLHNAPLFEKPPITKSPFPVAPKPAAPSKDGVKELMSDVIQEFESTTKAYLYYPSLIESVNVSRVMLDLLFAEAVQRDFLLRINHDYYQLLDKGKQYVIENELIK